MIFLSLKMEIQAHAFLPLRIILAANKMACVDALFTVKQCIKSNNFTILFEMIDMTQFFVPVCPALVNISFVTFSKTI